MAGGVTGVDDRGATNRLTFAGTWAAGDTYTLTISVAGVDYTLGAGRVTGVVPTFALTYNDRVHFVSGLAWYFSAVGDASQFEQQGVGSGFIVVSNNFGSANTLTSLAIYQSRMAVFSRRNISIWNVDPDPALFQQVQSLPNTGTIAPFSAQSLAQSDVAYIADTGIRSIRVRDYFDSAAVIDIGTPVDTLVQSDIASQSDTEKSQAVSTVEQLDGRYWLYLNNLLGDSNSGKFYVYSFFPTVSVAAWSTYLPTYCESITIEFVSGTPGQSYGITIDTNIGAAGHWQADAAATAAELAARFNGGLGNYSAAVNDNVITLTRRSGGTSGFGNSESTDSGGIVINVTDNQSQLNSTASNFVQRITTFNGVTYLRAAKSGGDLLFKLGSDYDNCPTTVILPWLDAKKPGTAKRVSKIDIACQGTWAIQIAPDINAPTVFDTVATITNSSFDMKTISYNATGTHFKVKLVNMSAGYARIGQILLHYVEK